MKDTLITKERKKTELITLLVCFVLANLCNLYSIIKFDTPWIELLSSLGFVAVAALVMYGIWTGMRLVWYGIKQLFGKKQNYRRS